MINNIMVMYVIRELQSMENYETNDPLSSTNKMQGEKKKEKENL